jgi:hypothetical protein
MYPLSPQHEAPREALLARNSDARTGFDFHGGVRPEKSRAEARAKIPSVIAPRHAERLREFARPAAQPLRGF